MCLIGKKSPDFCRERADLEAETLIGVRQKQTLFERKQDVFELVRSFGFAK